MMLSCSHISDSQADTSLLPEDAPESCTSSYGTGCSPEHVALSDAKASARPAVEMETIGLPHDTSEEEEIMPTDHHAADALPDISPSKSSDGWIDEDSLAKLRRDMGLSWYIEEMDEDIAEGRIGDDQLKHLFDDDDAIEEDTARASTPLLSRSRSTKGSSESPRSPASSRQSVSRKRKVAVIRDSSDEEGPAGSPIKHLSTEEIIVDVSSSHNGKAQKVKRRPAVSDSGESDEDEREVVERPKLKLKGLSKKELDMTKKEAAALQRNRHVRLEMHHAEVSMQDTLSAWRTDKENRAAAKPVSSRAARFSSSAAPRPTPVINLVTSDSSAFEKTKDQHYMGESLDVSTFQTQTLAHVSSKALNRTFVETDPIESSQTPLKEDQGDSIAVINEDAELPDAMDALRALEREEADKAERQRIEAERERLAAERREKAQRLARLKEQAAGQGPSAVAKKRLISSEDDLDIIEPPKLSAPLGFLQDYAKQSHAQMPARHVNRTESQLDRASSRFGHSKAEVAVTHKELELTLQDKARQAAYAARERRKQEYLEAGGQLETSAPTTTVENRPATDIDALIEKTRVEDSLGSDGADEDDGDFDPDQYEDEDVEMGSEAEEADEADEQDSGGEDEYGSADEQAFDIRPDSPRKEGGAFPARLPSDDDDEMSDRAEEMNKENHFSDMQPLRALDARRNLLNTQRSALSQLTASTEPASPTQIVHAPTVLVPFQAGSPMGDAEDGFSQLFAEEERADGPNIFDARPDSHFLPTQLQHPGRTLLPAFEGNAVLDDLVNSQLERHGPLNDNVSPISHVQQHWMNDQGLLTQHKPADVFEPIPEPSPDPFFAKRLQPSESLNFESQIYKLDSSPSRAKTGSPSLSPMKRVARRILASDDEDNEGEIVDSREDEDLPDTANAADAPTPVQPSQSPIKRSAFEIMAMAAKKQEKQARKEAKRREMNAFFEDQATRSDEEDGNRYGNDLLGNDSGEDDEGSSDDGGDLEGLVMDEDVAPELQQAQDLLAEEKHKEHLAADEARLGKRINRVIKGQERKKKAYNAGFDSDEDVDDLNNRERNRNVSLKRKDDDGTMESLASNPQTAAFAAGYIETHKPAEVSGAYGFLEEPQTLAEPVSDEEDQESSSLPIRQKTSRLFRRPAHTALAAPADHSLVLESEETRLSFSVGFIDPDGEQVESQRSQPMTSKPKRNAINGTNDVADLYIRLPGRQYTADQKREALESQGSYGDGRRAGNSRSSAVTSYTKRPAQKSASMPPPPVRSVSASVVDRPSGMSRGAGLIPVKSKSLGQTTKARFA